MCPPHHCSDPAHTQTAGARGSRGSPSRDAGVARVTPFRRTGSRPRSRRRRPTHAAARRDRPATGGGPRRSRGCAGAVLDGAGYGGRTWPRPPGPHPRSPRGCVAHRAVRRPAPVVVRRRVRTPGQVRQRHRRRRRGSRPSPHSGGRDLAGTRAPHHRRERHGVRAPHRDGPARRRRRRAARHLRQRQRGRPPAAVLPRPPQLPQRARRRLSRGCRTAPRCPPPSWARRPPTPALPGRRPTSRSSARRSVRPGRRTRSSRRSISRPASRSPAPTAATDPSHVCDLRSSLSIPARRTRHRGDDTREEERHDAETVEQLSGFFLVTCDDHDASSRPRRCSPARTPSWRSGRSRTTDGRPATSSWASPGRTARCGRTPRGPGRTPPRRPR